MEQDLTAKLDSTLEPLVGAGRFRAAVSAECDMNSGEQSEETFDPTHSVMVSFAENRRYFLASRARRRRQFREPRRIFPTAGSAARPRRRRDHVAKNRKHQLSDQPHTVKRTMLPQGAIKRLSVSVLIDHDVHWEGTGANASGSWCRPLRSG